MSYGAPESVGSLLSTCDNPLPACCSGSIPAHAQQVSVGEFIQKYHWSCPFLVHLTSCWAPQSKQVWGWANSQIYLSHYLREVLQNRGIPPELQVSRCESGNRNENWSWMTAFLLQVTSSHRDSQLTCLALMALICVPCSPLVAGWSPLSHTVRMLSYLVLVGTTLV
jgi:uncharacterized membrane protein YbaN (DUF454 family)